jgi:LacI family transcriptional regulator
LRDLSIVIGMVTKSKRPHPKPKSADELILLLGDSQDDFGKGGRRLANFFIDNPEDTALLTSAQVAERCGVHASSVVRLAQGLGFSGYSELQSLFQRDLSASIAGTKPFFTGNGGNAKQTSTLRLHLLVESGRSFNEAAQIAADNFCAANEQVFIRSEFHLPHTVDPQSLAQQIEDAARQADGLILVAREHPAVNAAVRSVVGRNVPVVCLTSDLPSSGRTTYVGSDQFASGATAGWYCGRMSNRVESGRVLFVYSVPFRCQLDREQGFRQVLRSEFPHLAIDERVASNESVDIIYNALRLDISKHGPPTAIYNVSGGNVGIGRALEDEGLAAKTIFVGHELNTNSRMLLERGIMDMTIGHDFDAEISMSVECIRMALAGQQPVKRLTQSQLYMRYNCAIF